MFKKLFFLTLFVFICGLNNTARAESIDVNNFSFEYDVNGELITEQTNITNVLGWNIRDLSGWATAWIFAVVEWGDSYEPADGNVVLMNATTHDPCYPVEFYQILDDPEAIIAENRRYTLTFNSIRSSVIGKPDINAIIFYSDGGTEGEGNDVTLGSTEVELTWPTWGQPGYSGMEEIKVNYTALAGADSIGENLGIKFRVLVEDPWLDGVFVGFDNVRVEWKWATDAWDPHPADGAEGVDRDVTLSWRPGVWAQSTGGSHEVYFGTSYEDVDSADRFDVSGVFQGAQDVNTWSILNYAPSGLDLGGVYYWRIDEVNETYSGTLPPPPPDGRWKGEVWSFAATGRATNPSPTDGARGVPVSAVLSWTPGTDSDTHDVYIGTNRAAVEIAGTGDDEFKGNHDVNSYDPSPLLVDTTYYWRIDEVNDVTVKGKVWSFTTRSYVVVDDMDSYALYVNDIFDTWLDYRTIFTNTEVDVHTEATDANLVRDGNSMLYDYDNARMDPNKNYGSMVIASISNLDIGPDWTINGAKAFSLYFYGLSGNSATVNDRMYVALWDSSDNFGVVYHPDANTLAEEEWHEWSVNLQDYNDAGVDLTDVSKIALGLGVYGGGDTKGGNGILYFDDFRLYAPRCFPDAYPLTGDIDGDCAVDGYDLAIMARDWLLGDYAATPALPVAEPVIWYMFDANTGTEVGAVVANSGTYGDSYDMEMGTFIDDEGATYIDADRIPSWTTDVAPPPDACDPNYSLDFSGATDGTGDFLDLPALNLNSNTVTITAWIKPGAGIQGSGDPESGESGYTGLINCRATDTVSAGLHYGGEWGGNWAWNGQLAYTWNDDDEYTWGFYSDLLIPELEWSFIAVAVESTKATLCLSDGISINFSENILEHEPEEFDGRTRIGADPSSDEFRCFRGLMDDVRIYDVTLTQSELMGLAQASYIPLVSPANLYDEEPMFEKHVNLRDFAILADNWLVEQLWP